MRQFIALFALVLFGCIMPGAAQDSGRCRRIDNGPVGRSNTERRRHTVCERQQPAIYNPYKPARGISIRLRSARGIFNGG